MVLLFFSSMAHAQERPLAGIWTITDFSITRTYVPDTLYPDSFLTEINHQDSMALAQDSAVWTLELLPNGDLVQQSNMRTGELESWSGSWAATDTSLSLELLVGEHRITIVYEMDLKDDLISLSRHNPMRTMIIETVFKRQ